VVSKLLQCLYGVHRGAVTRQRAAAKPPDVAPPGGTIMRELGKGIQADFADLLGIAEVTQIISALVARSAARWSVGFQREWIVRPRLCWAQCWPLSFCLSFHGSGDTLTPRSEWWQEAGKTSVAIYPLASQCAGKETHENQTEGKRMHYEVLTGLTPRAAFEHAIVHFGPRGAGLQLALHTSHNLVFQGGGGHVVLTVKPGPQTILELETHADTVAGILRLL